LNAHPLFVSFVKAAWENRQKSENLKDDVTSDRQIDIAERAAAVGEE
jgi:hypothetical protein